MKQDYPAPTNSSLSERSPRHRLLFMVSVALTAWVLSCLASATGIAHALTGILPVPTLLIAVLVLVLAVGIALAGEQLVLMTLSERRKKKTDGKKRAMSDWLADHVIEDDSNASREELEGKLKLALERNRLDDADRISQKLLALAENDPGVDLQLKQYRKDEA